MGRRAAGLRTAAVSSFSPLTFVGGVYLPRSLLRTNFYSVLFFSFCRSKTAAILNAPDKCQGRGGRKEKTATAQSAVASHAVIPAKAGIQHAAVRRLILFIRYSIPAKAGISSLRARCFSSPYSSCRNLFRHGLIPRIIYYPPFIRLDGNKLPCKCVPK